MTIAIGILSDSGIILGADTQYSTGTIVNYGEKVFPLAARANYRVVVAGAGDVGFIHAASQKIDAALPLRPTTTTALTAIIEKANKSYYEQYIIPQGPDKMAYELLIAIGMKDGSMELLKTTTNSTEIISDYAPIGTGGITAQPYMGMWRENMTAFESELMAAFVVKYAKTYDEYSGGETRIFSLLGTDLYKLDSSYISMADAYLKEFNRLTIDLILPHEVLDTEPEYYESGVAGIARYSAHQRRELVRNRIKAHIRVP